MSQTTSPLPPERATATPPTSSLENEASRLAQALADLRRSDASEVVLIRCASREDESNLVDRLMRESSRAGFATAALSLREHALEALDTVVREIVRQISPPTKSGHSPRHGLLSLLDAFAKKHGSRAASEFDDRVERLRAFGDLTLLASAYLHSTNASQREQVVFNAWLNGTELARRVNVVAPRAALNPKTARKALAELTRVVRALGFAGCALFFTDADLIVRRTPRQREKSYTVLRELIDNFDLGLGTMTTRLSVSGLSPFFEGEKSLESVAPLAGRLSVRSAEEPAPPHRSSVTLRGPDPSDVREPAPPARSRAKALRTLIRISQGLPPTEAVVSLSVGHQRIDGVIDRLFKHAEMAGSVFSILTGEYGAGKTHLLLHLAERALETSHPVFRLDVERLNLDLGNPQRHLVRLLEQSSLPLRHRPSALERAAFWSRSPNKLRELMRALATAAERDTEASGAARRALAQARKAKDPGAALEGFLTARDLERKTAAPNYRQDAYERLLLWIELLEELEGCAGPVVVIDEAENLYTTAAPRALRRTALRSLSFYCGGALPSACVVIAITPKVLSQLRADARELLAEVSEQRTVLPWEDATMLSRRLSRIKPEPVPALTEGSRRELVRRMTETHRSVRGAGVVLSRREIDTLCQRAESPRMLLRRAADELERLWWLGR